MPLLLRATWFLRAYQLAQPLTVASRPEYFGCFSFVELSDSAGAPGGKQRQVLATPALSDADFEARQAQLRRRLATIQHEALPLQ